MDILVGNYYLLNKELLRCTDIDFIFDTAPYQLYEVMRSIKGVLVFIEDHLERLRQGINKLGFLENYSENSLRQELSRLLIANHYREGNIKILCYFQGGELKVAAYFIQHSYPSQRTYNEGVKLVTFSIERTDPQVKQISINNLIQKKIEEKKKDTRAFEILLIDNEQYITEGSKSNFFLVKGNEIYSAPSHRILAGITRKYVLFIAEKVGIKSTFKNIHLEEIKEYDAAFICGTSPKILSVKRINDINFNVNNSIVSLIKNEYNTIIEEYILKYT